MLVQRKMSSKRKAILLAVSGVLAILIAYLLYTNFIIDRVALVQPIDVKVKVITLPKVNPQLATDFLTQDPYVRLRDSGSAPQGSVTAGRDNPFQGIEFYPKQ